MARFYILIAFQLFFHSVLNASLYQSWMPANQDNQVSKIGLHGPNTMYLKKEIEAADKELLELFEKCLVTYCVLVLEEKEYVVDKQAEDKLYALESYVLTNKDEYQKWASFAKRINTILPYRNTAVLGHMRRPFSYFCPTIDVYAAIEKIRATYPLNANYLDYLLKSPGVELDDLKAQLLQRISKPVNAADLILLFAIHVFDFNGDRDFNLANLEAALLKSKFGLNSLEAIHKVVESYNTDDDFISSGNDNVALIMSFDSDEE